MREFLWLSGFRTQLVSMRMQDGSLALLSGFSILPKLPNAAGVAKKKKLDEYIHRVRYGEKVSPNTPLSPNFHMFTNPEALQTSSFWNFIEAP